MLFRKPPPYNFRTRQSYLLPLIDNIEAEFHQRTSTHLNSSISGNNTAIEDEGNASDNGDKGMEHIPGPSNIDPETSNVPPKRKFCARGSK